MKLKFLAVVTLLIIGILPTSGKDWYYSRIQLQCEPAGAGLVYASTSTASTSNCTSTTYTGVYGRTANSNYYPCPWNIYTKPVDPTKYKFLYWECTLRVGDILSYWGKRATAVGTQYTTASVEGKIYAGLSLAGVANDGGSIDPGTVNAIWVAHYEELEHHDVTVSSNNNALGSVAITGPDGTAENQVGDVVTITARTENHRIKFLGWKLNGEWVRNNAGNIIREVPYSFTVTEQNKGEYVAYFEGGHDFVRIKNRNTGHYISAQEYFSGSPSEGLIGLQNALATFSLNDDLDASLDDQGSVILWSSYPRPNTVDQTVNVMEIRGASTEPYYTVSKGVFLYMSHNADNSFDIGNGGNSSFHIVEYNGGIRGSNSVTSSMNYLWDFEGMDLDLTTKENYYTPDQLIQGENGLWYGTHRASWNTKYDTDQITAYIITGITDGVLQKTEVTGGIIPAGMAVLLECKTNDRTLNVMIPTLETASFTSSSNILTTCEIYFPNQSVNTSENYKTLTMIDGHIGFGGNALSKVDGNHGYLQLQGDAVLENTVPNITLAELIASGNTQKTYNITDLTCVYIQGNTLYCKDDNNALNKSVIAEGEEDYIKTYTALQDGDWDQSNWIAINLPEGSSIGTDYMEAIFDHRLNNVVGHLKSKVNPEFEATLMPTADEENPYNENTYITCNFSDEHQPGVVNGEAVNLFFVAPKPMEIAQVEWAMWDAASEMFIMPHAADDSRLHGAFLPNFSMLENGSNPNPQDGYSYHFPALIKLTETSPQGSAPILAAGNSSTWTVYPLEWNSTSIITAIDNLQAGKTVTRVVYYNMMGVASDKPHQGINIVETRYSDGSRSVEKVMK
jgi:hypothetical protein